MLSYLLITCNNPRSLSLYVPYKLNQTQNTLYLSRAQAHSSPSLIGCLLVYATSPRTRSFALVLDLYSPRSFLRSRSSSLSILVVYLYLIYASLQPSYHANISILFAHNIFTKYLNKTLSNQIKIYLISFDVCQKYMF